MDKVVNNFCERIQNNVKNYNDSFFEERIAKIANQIDTKDCNKLYTVSCNLRQFLKNVDFQDPLCVNILKNMVRKYTNEPYLLNIIKPCYISTLKFKRFLEEYDLYKPKLIKEFFISFYILILYMPFGTIKNMVLFESIQILWMLIDNIMDDKDLRSKKHLLKPIFKFLKDKIYKRTDVMKFMYTNRDNMCIKILLDIYNNQDLKDKEAFFDDVRELFYYSYTRKGITNEMKPTSIKEILKVSMTKAYHSHKLFTHCLNNKIEENEDFYYLAFISQLSDDLLDIREDFINDGNTIFTVSNRRNRSIFAMTIVDVIEEKFGRIKKYLILSILDAILYNKNLHDQKFMKEILKYRFINVDMLDLQKLEDDVFTEDKLDKYLQKDYINIYENHKFYKLSDDDILTELEMMSLFQESEI